MNYFIALLIGLLFIGIFIILIKFFAKKTDVLQEEIVSELSDEQIKDLKDNQVVVKNNNEKNYSWYQKGLIGKVEEKQNRYYLKVIWYNTVINNNTINNFQYADIKLSKDEFDAKGLKKGNIVKIFIEPNKFRATIV